MAPRDDKKKNGLGCGVCPVVVVVAEGFVEVVRVGVTVSRCERILLLAQGHLSTSQLLRLLPASLLRKYIRPYSFLGCLLRPRGSISAFSFLARSDTWRLSSLLSRMLEALSYYFFQKEKISYYIIFSKRKKSQIEFWNCDIYGIE